MTALERADSLYLKAIFEGSVADSDISECLGTLVGPEPAVQLARGKLRHCLNLAHRRQDTHELACFINAADQFSAAKNLAGLADALFWQGCYHQVLCDDVESALPLLTHALDIARHINDRLIASYCLRHLGIADHQRGDFEQAEQRLTESTRLRHELGFTAGVAANLVGLAYVALARGDQARAQTHARNAIAAAQTACAAKVLADAHSALEQSLGAPGRPG